MLLAVMLALGADVPTGVGNPSTWITENDYPKEALEQGEEGSVTVSLRLNLEGVPEDCVVLKSSASKTLDSATCTLLKQRAKFPSLAGLTSASKVQTVHWQIPSADPISAIKSGLVAVFSVAPSGAVKSCETSKFGDMRIEMVELCDIAKSPEALSYLVGAQPAPSDSPFLRLYIEPKEQDQDAISVNSTSEMKRLMFKAEFMVLASGFATGCQVKFADPLFTDLDICGAFSKTDPDFDKSSLNGVARDMVLVFDGGLRTSSPKLSKD